MASSSGTGDAACPKCGTPGAANVTHVCMTAGEVPDPPATRWLNPPSGTGAARLCHCGLSIAPRDPDPWEGRMDDYCTSCAANRCDCYPDTCPVEHPAASSGTGGGTDGFERESIPEWVPAELRVAAPASDMRLTVEFEVAESDSALIDKLVAYARRIGVTHFARDSHDANEHSRRNDA